MCLYMNIVRASQSCFVLFERGEVGGARSRPNVVDKGSMADGRQMEASEDLGWVLPSLLTFSGYFTHVPVDYHKVIRVLLCNGP